MPVCGQYRKGLPEKNLDPRVPEWKHAFTPGSWPFPYTVQTPTDLENALESMGSVPVYDGLAKKDILEYEKFKHLFPLFLRNDNVIPVITGERVPCICLRERS